MTLHAIPANKASPNATTIEYLREVLARAEAGEVQSFIGVFWKRDGDYELYGSSHVGRLAAVGALMDCVYARLERD
jgi:hypothetical protein